MTNKLGKSTVTGKCSRMELIVQKKIEQKINVTMEVDNTMEVNDTMDVNDPMEVDNPTEVVDERGLFINKRKAEDELIREEIP